MSEPECFLRLPQVRQRTGLSKTEIYRRVSREEFPPSRRLSHRVAVWLESEVVQWQAERLGAAG